MGRKRVSNRPETEQPAGSTTADLRVYLLGPPGVEWVGRPLIIHRRQVRALLYHLAARSPPVPREHLCFLFWSDTPESTARRNLSHLLTHLRRALPDPEVLLTYDDQVGLDAHRAWSDTVAFERLCSAPEPQHRTEIFQRAVDLYRGPFLAGFSLPASPEFEAWATQERHAWERIYLEALAALIEEWTVSREHDAAIAAIACARRYLQTDDLAEDVHRRLIELYAASGDRSAALRQFERCAATLERELGVSPLPETRAVYQAILEDRPPPLRRPVAKLAWATLPSLDVPLVGRDDALRQLKQAYTRARFGYGGVVLISGEPGIGKSRLMQDFVTELEGQATVVVGGGHEAERGMPYWSLVEALRPHLPAVDWAALSVEPLYLAEVSRLLPELRTLLPDLPAPATVELEQEKGGLFLALAHWLLSLAAQRPPLILCLDDLHWADEATLSWLGYLARRLRRAPVLVLGAYRTEEAVAVAALRAGLARLGVLREVRLEGLPVTEVLRLIRHLSGQSSGADLFSQCLHRETGGNPFFLLETLRVMFEAGILWEDETGWSTGVDETTEDYCELPLPDTVSQAIRDRLRRLSPQVRQVLEAGAVIGHQFDVDLIRDTSGRRESEVVDALDTLLARQVVSEQDGSYRFNHDLFRAVVYRDLSYGRRRLLHRRAGEALERLRPDDVAVLTWHFERAEELGKAARHALQAGFAAKAIFAHIEARTHFDRTLALLEQEARRLREPEAIVANRRLQVQALYERGWALRLLGDMEAYAHDSQEVARLADLLDDQRTLAHLHWREAYTHRWFCRYAKGRKAAEEGVRLSQAAHDRLLEAMCWREVGRAARATGDYDGARVALERALGLFVDLGDTVYELHALGNLSTLYCRLGEYEQAVDLARQALTRCDKAELPLERRLPLGDLGAAAALMGDTDLAQKCLLESLDIARKIADCTQEIFCLGHLGWLCVRLNQPVEALEHVQAALTLAKRIDSRTEQSWLQSGLAEAYRLIGDLDQAVEHARRALEMAQAHGRAYDQERTHRILAELGEADL